MADIEAMGVSADGTPIVKIEIIDKETGKKTPVNVATCAEAVVCREGIPMEEHLQNIYEHMDDGGHLTAEEKAALETQDGAQEKADDALEAAKRAASLMVANAKDTVNAFATQEATKARTAAYNYTDKACKPLQDHAEDQNNPHGVTAAQIGLGNVPNKATNDLTPTYTQASALYHLTSGEKLATAFGKIAKAVSSIIDHLANKANPHAVTAKQAGALPTAGGTMTGTLTMDGGYIVLKRGKNYGTESEIPADLPDGGVWFKVVE